jgi:hypothetical protein
MKTLTNVIARESADINHELDPMRTACEKNVSNIFWRKSAESERRRDPGATGLGFLDIKILDVITSVPAGKKVERTAAETIARISENAVFMMDLARIGAGNSEDLNHIAQNIALDTLELQTTS